MAEPDPLLSGWMPILGPLSIWFAHFMTAWGAVSIFPDHWLAHAIAIGATLIALPLLALLFLRMRAARPTSDQTAFAKRFGLGSVLIAAVATLFDAVPALLS